MSVTAEGTETAVALEFRDFRTFINTFSPNVSQSGMFLKVDGNPSPGSEIEFDLRLEEGGSLIRGRGEVGWTLGDKGSKAGGIGVRFLDLAPESVRLIERIVDVRTKAGRRLFDIEQEAPPKAQSGAGEAKRDASRATETEPEEATTDELCVQIESLELERAEEQERFKAELEAARAAAALLEERLEEQAAELRRWSEQGKHALTERERLEADQEALAQGMEAAQAQIERFVTDRKASRDTAVELEEVKRSLAEAQATEEEQRGQVEAARTEIVRLETESKVLRESADQLEETKSSLAETQAAREALEGQLEAAQAEVARLETESEALRESADQLEVLESSFAETRAAEKALREELSTARSALEETERKAGETESRLRSELEQVEESRTGLREKLEQEEAELGEARRRFEEAAERTLELEHETTALGSQLAEAREQIDSLESQTVTLRAETEELGNQRDELELKLAAQTKIATKASKLSQRARAERGRLQEFFAEAQATLEMMQQEELRLEHQLEEESAEVQPADDPAPQDPASEVPAEAVEGEIPTEEGPEEPRQSGLWAAIARTLGHPAEEEHESAAELQVDGEEDGQEAVVEKGPALP